MADDRPGEDRFIAYVNRLLQDGEVQPEEHDDLLIAHRQVQGLTETDLVERYNEFLNRFITETAGFRLPTATNRPSSLTHTQRRLHVQPVLGDQDVRLQTTYTSNINHPHFRIPTEGLTCPASA